MPDATPPASESRCRESPAPSPSPASAALLSQLEEISRSRPDRVLRLRGLLPAGPGSEPFELVIYRGFSSSTTHPTAYDPDQPALPEAALIESAELLRGPLNPSAEQHLAGPLPVQVFQEPAGWA